MGCQIGPQYRCPDMEMPPSWTACPEICEETRIADWWGEFGDPLLSGLMERAAAENIDVQLALLRVLEVRAELKQKASSLFPQINGSFSLGKAQLSREFFKGNGAECFRTNTSYFELGFDALWELDLFGVTAHEMNALQAKVGASCEEVHQVWVTLFAEIAKHYMQLRRQQQQLRLLEAEIASLEATVELTEELWNIGMATSADLHQAEGELSTWQAKLPEAKQKRDRLMRHLAILVGGYPDDLICLLESCQELPRPLTEPTCGLPSDLLRRRPDIRKAERELAAATEQVGAAVASLFPRISLQGFVGSISRCLSSLITPGSATWLIGPQILFPIFNSQQLLRDVDFSKVKTQEALYLYQKTVLEALEETENAIAEFHYAQEGHEHFLAAKEAALLAEESMRDLYCQGFKSYLDVLIAERASLRAQELVLESEAALLLNQVAIYKALGGGWEGE